MRIEVDITREDWQAYCRFYYARVRGLVRYQWLILAAMAVVVTVVLWLFDWLGDRSLDLPSAVLGMALICVIILLFSRTNQAAKAIPESWLGWHVYDLLPDALHTQRSASTARYPWTSIREVCEDPAYVYLLLDNITTILLPKRAMEPHGGPEAVKAEIERLRRGDVTATAELQAVASTAGNAVISDASAIASSASGVATGPSASASTRRGRLALTDNLLAGLRLCTFLRVQARHFRPSARQVALLIVLSFAIWLGVERVVAEGEVYLSWYAVAEMTWLFAVAVVTVLLLTPRAYSSDTAARVFTALASVAPFLMLVTSLALTLPLEYPWYLILLVVLVVYVLVVVIRAQRASIGETPGLAICKSIAGFAAVYLAFTTTVWERPQPWYANEEDGTSRDEWVASERVLFAQPDLVDAAVERLSAGTPGRTDAYFVGFAGYGEQGVFEKEIRFANDAFGKRLDLEGHSLQLVNSPEPRDETTPLATASGLTRSLAGIAGKMNPKEDVLFMFLTSHGSEDAELSVSEGYLPLQDLDSHTLRKALDEAGIQWRVIVISACHAGSFIPELSDERTLIITAARADRSSFGCSDERDLTYFGEAFLRDALPVSTDLLDAFERAKQIVTEREREEGADPSEPQLFVGTQMKSKLAEIPLRGAKD